MSRRSSIYRFIFLILFMSACSLPGSSGTPEDQPAQPETISPSETPADTPTPLAPVGAFVTPAEADADLVETLSPLISTYIRDLGLRYQVLPSLTAEDFNTDDFEIVVVLPPFSGLDNLAQASPETKFLAVGFNDLEPLDNLSILRSGGGAYDVQGFIAGYIAAMITTDWRVGVLSIQESDQALAAREGFQVGVKYYCGLCNPKYAPTGINYIYPKYIDLPVDATDLEIEANVNFLVDRVVNTYYVVPQLGNDRIYRMLVGYQKRIIGPGSDFREEYQDYWVTSLEYDLPAALEEFWSVFLTTETGIVGTPPLLLTDVNSDLLSPGKVMMVEKVLEDLSAGLIKTSFEE